MSVPSLDYTLGALEVGILISSFLYGVTTVQVYLYYLSGVKDQWYIRCLVPLIWTIESFLTWSMCDYLYYLTVTNYGNLESVSHPRGWSINTSGFLNILVGALVQSFFAHRIYALSGKWYISLISWTGSFLALTAALAITIISLPLNFDEFAARYSWLATTGLSLPLFVDIVNTVSLCTYLRIERKGFSSTDSVLNKLFVWTLETGLITSLGAILMMIFLLALPNTTMRLSISIFYAKLYSNSLMASLNARNYLRNITMGSSTGSTGRTSEGATLQFASQSRPHTHDLELTSTQRAASLTCNDMPNPESKMRLSKGDVSVDIV